MSKADKPYLTINKTQDALIKKRVSAVDLVDNYLKRIQKFDKKINSFITLSDELAYSQAKKVDKIVSQYGSHALKNYPLLGVVVSFKDIFLTKGLRTTAGANVLKSYIPAYSATAVKRLSNAGCICIGKTNMDAWAHGSSGERSDFGDTLNPWSYDHVPGGSSSGSGASVSAGFSLISTGTDTCGSIRLPANYCGVFGFKPTYGAVSRYGIIAMASSLDSVGHFANSTDDIEKVFNVTKGKDGSDSTLDEKKLKDKKKKLKIGIPKEFFIEGIDDDVKEEVLKAAKIFEKQGLDVSEVSMPNTKYGISVYYIIQPAEVSSNLGRFDGIRYGNDRTYFSDEAKRRIMLGTYVLSAGYYDAYYLKAMKVRSKIIEDVDNVFDEVDAIIAPVAPTPPFKLGEKVDDPLKMYLTDIFAATANLSGIPGLSIPSGFTKNGLPLGFQLMGPRFSETLLFKLSNIFEKAVNWNPKLPELKI